MLLGTTELGTTCPGDPQYSYCLQVGRPAEVKLECWSKEVTLWDSILAVSQFTEESWVKKIHSHFWSNKQQDVQINQMKY